MRRWKVVFLAASISCVTASSFSTSAFAEGPLYTGDRNAQNLYDGKGVLSYPDGGRYEGQWSNGKEQGQGVRTWKDGTRYEGEWQNGIAQGKGSKKFPNGDSYAGEFVNGHMHGNGLYTWASGDTYQGTFENDLPSGKGLEAHKNGDKYEGEFVAGRRTGEGILRSKNGTTLAGEWKDGFPINGVLTYANKSNYNGAFANGLFEGQGTLTYANGDTYTGEWKSGKREGQGTCTHENVTEPCSWNKGKRIALPKQLAKAAETTAPVVAAKEVKEEKNENKAAAAAITVAGTAAVEESASSAPNTTAPEAKPTVAESKAATPGSKPTIAENKPAKAAPKAASTSSTKGSAIAATTKATGKAITTAAATTAVAASVAASKVVPPISVKMPSLALASSTPKPTEKAAVMPAIAEKKEPAKTDANSQFKKTIEQEKINPPTTPVTVAAPAVASNMPQQPENEFKVKHTESWWKKRVALISDDLQLNISDGDVVAHVRVKNFKGPGTYIVGSNDVVVYDKKDAAYHSSASRPGRVVIKQIDKKSLQGSIEVTAYADPSSMNSKQVGVNIGNLSLNTQPSEY